MSHQRSGSPYILKETDTPKINSYMPQLDGLRALAVSAVMAGHFIPFHHINTHDFLSPGYLGVRLFFVLSGFLITGILLDGRRNASPFFTAKQFYIRRFLRIFPIYYLTLFIVTVLDVKSARSLSEYSSSQSPLIPCIIKEKQGVNP